MTTERINHSSKASVPPNILEEWRRLAEINDTTAHQTVEAYRCSLEQRDGIPIEVRWQPNASAASGTVISAWLEPQATKKHLIQLTGSIPDLVKPSVLAHEFTHLDLCGQAKHATKLKVPDATNSNYNAMMACVSAHLDTRMRKRLDAEQLQQWSGRLLNGLVDGLVNISSDMAVETRFRDAMPVLGPAQFLAAHFTAEQRKKRPEPEMWRHLLPRKMYRDMRALRASYLLFLDRLFDNVTDYFAEDRETLYGEIAEQLVSRFEAMYPTLGPGDEYGVMDSFADILGFRDLYTWVSIPRSKDHVNPLDEVLELALAEHYGNR